jgi:cytoskeletal protein RodZ
MKECPKCGGSGVIQDDAVLGVELRKKREGIGLTLREVSRRMKISASYLCDLEHGRRIWSPILEHNYRQAVK